MMRLSLKKIATSLCVAVTVSSALGCGLLMASMGGGFEDHVSELKKRATFDLDCPKSQLNVTELEEGHGPNYDGSVAGVSGCGQRATYIRRNARWIMNNSTVKGRDSQ